MQTGIEIKPDCRRVVIRLFVPGQEDVGPGTSRAVPVIERILGLSEAATEVALADVIRIFSPRHRRLTDTLLEHASQVAPDVDSTGELSHARRLLLGACFSNEVAIEGAALCNPSIVLHPQQPADGSARFVMSVRGVGEGHRSSIGFRTGTVSASGVVDLDLPGAFPTTARVEETSASHDSSYRVVFPAETEISERVLLPHASAESHGMEDARFVRFVDDDQSVTYYGTYTAFDGIHIKQHVLQTDDFQTFAASAMTGEAAIGKGLALFPRRIGGRFAALSRSDRETNSIAFSDDIRSWTAPLAIQVPERAWEVLQLGNCGSPIETDRGWLVLTHGVGPMRVYSLGAILLDLDDPAQVIACCDTPLLGPGVQHRDGYVPSVIYTCGALAHNDTLVIPYGVADQRIEIVTVSISELVDHMLWHTVSEISHAAALGPTMQ